MSPSCPVVLIANADCEIRGQACAILETAGCITLSAADGEEAYDFIRYENRWIDVAILDLIMPQMGGVPLMRQLRLVSPRCAVILTCGDTRSYLLGKWADYLLRKPFGRNELVRAVQAALDRRRAGKAARPHRRSHAVR
jgi:DNA-binding response OmpR family regulator